MSSDISGVPLALEGPLDRIRLSAQLEQRGIADKNSDNMITSDEIDSNRVPGGLNEVLRAAGTDGVLQLPEVSGIKIRQNESMESATSSYEKAATKQVRDATEKVRDATLHLHRFRMTSRLGHFLDYIEKFNRAGEHLRKLTERDLGLSSQEALNGMKHSFTAMKAAMDLVGRVSIDEGRRPRGFDEETAKLSRNSETISSTAEYFDITIQRVGFTFPNE